MGEYKLRLLCLTTHFCFFQRLPEYLQRMGQWVSFHSFSRRAYSLALIAALNLSLAQDLSEGLVASGAVEEAYC